jgi:hypothetical protein
VGQGGRLRIPACCAIMFSLTSFASAQESHCTREQADKMKTIFTVEEVARICGFLDIDATARPEGEVEHAGEPIPRVNWGALEDYFEVSPPRLGSSRYKPELDIKHNALEFDVRATSKIWPLGRMMLSYWRACFYDQDNIQIESQPLQFEPLYGAIGWTAGMRGKGYILLPEKLSLASVSAIRVKRLPCN